MGKNEQIFGLLWGDYTSSKENPVFSFFFIYIYHFTLIVRVFPTGGDGGSPPHQPKICSSPNRLFPPHQRLIAPLNNSFQVITLHPIKTIFNCSHCSYTIFVLISYSLDTQVRLNLILIDVQYSKKGVFSF